ncbi:lymphoid enhancer-binding factor 1-like [Synchiropus picturatus]
MVFMRENREIVTRTLKPKHSVETNTILGEMWRKMSTDEQEIYYQKATEERRIHAEKYPEWSSQDNYGKKVKRQRKKKSIIV